MPGVPFDSAASTSLVSPYQGWVSHQMLQRIPADVVTMSRSGPSATMLTLIVPAAPGTYVATAISGPHGGPYRVRIRVGSAVSVFSVTAGGAISLARPV